MTATTMTEAYVDNYLGITREDLDSLNPDDLKLSNSAENVLKEFRSLDCTVCAHHFGYQNRWDPKILLCSPRCLSVAHNKVKSLPPGQHPFAKHLSLTGTVNAVCKGGVTAKHEGSTDVPRPVQQGLGNQNQVNIQMPRINSRDANEQKDQRYSTNSEIYLFRDKDARKTESSYGSERIVNGGNAVRGGRGGYNNTTNRGGRGGGIAPRIFGNGRSDRASDDSPFNGNEERQDWGAKATDEIDSKIEVDPAHQKPVNVERPLERSSTGKENTDPTTKSLQMNNKEAMLNAARQARIVRPACKSADVTPPAAIVPSNGPVVTATPAVRKESPQVEAPIPKPPVEVRAPARKELPETPKETEKKIWTTEDLILSLSLVNMAPCTISFNWSPTKLTLVALADDSKLKKFQEDLNAYCSKAPPMTRVPCVGDILFALYSGEYYRARVDRVNAPKKQVLVTFIDFGDALGVEFSDCRDPDDELMKNNPVYGVIFNTSLNVECPENLVICEELLAALDMEKLTLQIESSSAFEFTGKLYLDEKRTWNEILEKQIIASNPAAGKSSSDVPTQPPKPAQSAPSAPVVKSAPIVTSAPPPPVVKSPPVLSASPAPVVKSPPVTTTTTPPAAAAVETQDKSSPSVGGVPRSKPVNPFGASRPSPVRRTIHNVQWSPSIDSAAHVHVNYLWEYNKMTVSAKEDDAGLEKLSSLIGDYAAAAPPMQRIPSVDEIVIGPYEGAYYRGRVTAVEGDMVSVEFLDYGDHTKVKSSELRELSNEINAHPIYGVVLMMDGVPDVQRTDALDAEQPASGQLEIVNMSTGCYTGRLWISNDLCWNDFVNEYVAGNGK